MDQWLGGGVSALHSVVAGAISSGRDNSIHCWWDLIRLKQLSSVSICCMQAFARFSGHGNSIHKAKNCFQLYNGICSLLNRSAERMKGPHLFRQQRWPARWYSGGDQRFINFKSKLRKNKRMRIYYIELNKKKKKKKEIHDCLLQWVLQVFYCWEREEILF